MFLWIEQYLPPGRSPGGRYCPGQGPGNSKEHPTVLPDTTSASPRYCINIHQIFPQIIKKNRYIAEKMGYSVNCIRRIYLTEHLGRLIAVGISANHSLAILVYYYSFVFRISPTPIKYLRKINFFVSSLSQINFHSFRCPNHFLFSNYFIVLLPCFQCNLSNSIFEPEN